MPDTPDEGIEGAIERYRAAIPAHLRSLGIWLVWRFESAARAGDKPLKVPYSVRTGMRRSGIQGSPEDVANLVTFDQALEALRSGRWTGLGIAHVPGCGLNSWDFDSAIDASGIMAPELDALLRAAGTYVEISPSGRGVRMVALGTLPSIKRIHPSGHNIECFGESGFVTITGRAVCNEETIAALPPHIEQTLRDWLQADTAEQPHTRTDQLTQARGADPVYTALKAKGSIKRDWPDGRSSIVCPFEAEHTSGSGRSDTVYFLPNTNGYAQGHFHCLHAHCATRRDDAFTAALGIVEPDLSALLNPGAGAAAPGDLLLDVAGLRSSVGSLRWLVKHNIPASSIGIVYGPSGSFKSFIVLDLALRVAHGLPWLGNRTKQGSVVYVAAEGGMGLLGRIDAWHQKHALAATMPFRVCVVPLMLDHTRDLARLSNAIAESDLGNPALIVLDTMSQTMAGDENEARDTATYLRGIGGALRARFDSTVLPVHHTGHTAGDRPRGSSAIKGNVDFLYAVTRAEGQMAALLECKKQKDGRDGDAYSFTLERMVVGQDEEGDELTSLVAHHHDAAAAVLASAARPSRYEVLLLELTGNGRLYGELRDEFYVKLGNEKPDTKKKAFSRAFKTLVESRMIVEKDNCVFQTGADRGRDT